MDAASILAIFIVVVLFVLMGASVAECFATEDGYYGTLDLISPGRYEYHRIPKSKRQNADNPIILCKAIGAGPYWPDGAELIFEKNAGDFEYGHFYLIRYHKPDGRYNSIRWGKIVQCTATGMVPGFSSPLPKDNNFKISGKLIGVKIDDVYTYFDVTRNLNKPITNI